MTYELAKQLEDAGFPQDYYAGAVYLSPDGPMVVTQVLGDWRDFDQDEGNYYAPTLSELIRACGDKFFALFKKGPTVWIADGGEWIGGYFGNEYCIQGKTPEEAVAKLWLALNKKQ